MTIPSRDLHKLTYHSADGRKVVKLIHRHSRAHATSDPHVHTDVAFAEAMERLEAVLEAGAA